MHLPVTNNKQQTSEPLPLPAPFTGFRKTWKDVHPGSDAFSVIHSVWWIQCDVFSLHGVMLSVWCSECNAQSVMHSMWCIQCDAFSAVHSVCRERRLPITHGAVLDEVTLIELKQSTHDWNILLPHGRCNLAELCRKVTQAFRTVSMNNRQLTVEFKYNTLGFELECAAASWFCSVL